MKRKIFFILAAILILTISSSGCAQGNSSIPDGAAIVIIGEVNTETGWLEDDIRAMETLDVESENSKGEAETYTGVPVNTLLDLVGVKASATAVVFSNPDGESAEVTLVDMRACSSCILSFRNQGGFSLVAPDFGKNVQIKGVDKIAVK